MGQRADYVKNLPQERVELKGRIEHETYAAILFHVETEDAEHWFPLSQVHQIHREFPSTGFDRLVVSAWIVKKKGLLG